MPITPLHVALGETDPAMTIDLIRRACAEQVVETDVLDFKSQLPLTASDRLGRSEQALELVKDIAAMANGRGGLIVYGVREDTSGPTSSAAELTPVHGVDESTRQTIRRFAANLIYPPVVDLKFEVIPVGDESGGVVLTMQIPESLEAPHLVRPRGDRADQGWFIAPYRHGPDTHTMVEKQLESAYARRRDYRRQRNLDLRALYDDLSAVTAGAMPWVVAVARPVHPIVGDRRGLSGAVVSQVFERAWGASHDRRLAMQPHIVLPGGVRPALRRFRQDGTRDLGGAVPRTVADIHFNGCVGIAWRRGGAFSGDAMVDKQTISATDPDNVCLDLFHLVRSTADAFTIPGDYEVRIGIEPNAVMFRRMHHYSGQHEEDAEFAHFVPLEASWRLSEGPEALVDDVVDLAQDAMSQLGMNTTLGWLRETPPTTMRPL